MDFEGLDLVFWVKFIVLSVPLIILMWYFADGLKWKILFSVSVPIGVGFALLGKSIKLHQ